MRNDGGPAFPVNWQEWHDQRIACMTLRDYFAAKALVGTLASIDVDTRRFLVGEPDAAGTIAKACWSMADAMIKAREGGNA